MGFSMKIGDKKSQFILLKDDGEQFKDQYYLKNMKDHRNVDKISGFVAKYIFENVNPKGKGRKTRTYTAAELLKQAEKGNVACPTDDFLLLVKDYPKIDIEYRKDADIDVYRLDDTLHIYSNEGHIAMVKDEKDPLLYISIDEDDGMGQETHGYYLSNIMIDSRGNSKYMFSSSDGSAIDFYANGLQQEAKKFPAGNIAIKKEGKKQRIRLKTCNELKLAFDGKSKTIKETTDPDAYIWFWREK